MLSFPYILSHQAPATRQRHRHRTPSKEGAVVEKKESRLFKTKEILDEKVLAAMEMKLMNAVTGREALVWVMDE
jgi:hypothetical protein